MDEVEPCTKEEAFRQECILQNVWLTKKKRSKTQRDQFQRTFRQNMKVTKIINITQNSLDTRKLKTIWNKCRTYLRILRIQANNLANWILWSLTAGDEQQ